MVGHLLHILCVGRREEEKQEGEEEEEGRETNGVCEQRKRFNRSLMHWECVCVWGVCSLLWCVFDN